MPGARAEPVDLTFRADGSSAIYTTNSLTLSADGGAVDLSTIPSNILASFRYLGIVIQSNLTLPSGTAPFVTFGTLLNAGNLSIGGVDNASTAAGGYDRPNATGMSPYLDNPTPSRYWNPDAFVESHQMR